MKPKPKLSHWQTEKAVDRALRAELEERNRNIKREKKLRARRKEIRKVLRAKKKQRLEQEESDKKLKQQHYEATKAARKAKREADKLKKDEIKIEIARYRAKRAAQKAEEEAKKEYGQDASTRHYQMRFKSFPKQKDITKVNQNYDLEELNKRRANAQVARQASVIKMRKMQAKAKEEEQRVKDLIRQADHPLDKLSIKLHYEIRKNLKKLSEIFAIMDTDGSGTVTYKEMRSGLFRVGIKLNTKEAQLLCDGLDKDGDGEIAYKELARFLAQTKGGEESAAMVIQARLRSNKVKTKTLAQKKEEYKNKVAKEQNARLSADRKAWKKREKEIEREIEDESLAFNAARRSNNNDEDGEQEGGEETEAKRKSEEEAAEAEKGGAEEAEAEIKAEKEGDDEAEVQEKEVDSEERAEEKSQKPAEEAGEEEDVVENETKEETQTKEEIEERDPFA